MGLFKIFFTMATLLNLTWGDDELLSIELSLPDIMSTFTSIDQALRSLQGSDITITGGGESLGETLMMKMQQFDGGPKKIKKYEFNSDSKRMYKNLRKGKILKGNLDYVVS